jgi:hypothetical protein
MRAKVARQRAAATPTVADALASRYDSDMIVRLRHLLLPLLVVLAPLMAEDNLKYGKPACSGPVLDKKYFVVCYDEAHKVPTGRLRPDQGRGPHQDH